jgi:hypothetical protein
MNLRALRLVHAQYRRSESRSGRPQGYEPYLFLLPGRRNLTGDFQRFLSEDGTPPIELA